MWLRDSLPFDLTLDTSDRSIAKVMIYGYDSTVVGSKSTQNIEDIATKFNASLQKLANTSVIRPIILIGHSLGGLIIKQVRYLVQLHLFQATMLMYLFDRL
jgi:triacylglycerol esterase/lipase EstA (alpha/beta hydrolase family)